MVTENWSQVPLELLGLIAEHTTSIEDYIRFGAVCRSWQSEIARKRQFNFSPRTLPWLMFPSFMEEDEDDDDDDDEDDCVHGYYCDDQKEIESNQFFSVSEKKFNKLKIQTELRYCCWGSPYGWLVMFCNGQLELLNPLSGNRFSLPPFSTTDNWSHCIRKAVLSIPFSSSITKLEEKDQFIVFVISTVFGNFGFRRPQDSTWSTVEDQFGYIEDIIQMNDHYYIVHVDGSIGCFDIASPSPVVTEFMLPPEDMDCDNLNFYLVELLGELHMIVKYDCFEEFSESHHLDADSRPFEMGQLYYFKVFKLDICGKKWERVFTLGDYAIFVSYNTSFSVLVSGDPQCKSSSIYFTDHWTRHLNGVVCCGNIGIFNLETEALETLFTGDDVVSLCSNPTWFTPNLGL